MDRKGKKANTAVHIGAVLKKALRAYRRDSSEDLSRIWEMWDSVVGELISENTRPYALNGKILLVHVSSSTWIHQLQFLKKDLIEKVNHTLGTTLVEEIKFKIGSF